MDNKRLSVGDISYLKSEDGQGFERIFSVQLQEPDADARLQWMVAAIRSGQLPDSVLITPMSRPADLAQRRERLGFALDTSGRCMAMGLADDMPPPAPDAAVSVNAVELRQRETWLHIVRAGLFGCDLLSPRQLDALFERPGAAFFLGHWCGDPVTAAMTINDGATAVVELVATLPQARRQGVASAVLLRALRNLREHGVASVSLRAEVDGIGLYRRLGFRECGVRTVASYDWNKR